LKKRSQIAALIEEINVLREQIAGLQSAGAPKRPSTRIAQSPGHASRRAPGSKNRPRRKKSPSRGSPKNIQTMPSEKKELVERPISRLPVYELKEVWSAEAQSAQMPRRLQPRLDPHRDDFFGGILNVARIQWLTGRWNELADIDLRQIESHPDRAQLALLAASGNHQIGKTDQGRFYLGMARKWGCDPNLALRVLAAGVHRNLAEAARLRGDQALATKHQAAELELVDEGTKASKLAIIAAEGTRATVPHHNVVPRLTTVRNVFVLCTGRCGSKTFAEACKHLDNFSAAHESRAHIPLPDRFEYPAKHIEVDNRLSWFLAELGKCFHPAHTLYVHLTRNEEAVALSHLKRWSDPYRSSIIRAFSYGIVMAEGEWQEDKQMELCRAYVRTVTSNIEMFLRGVNFVRVNIEDPTSFSDFLKLAAATGNISAAMQTFATVHNATAE
jgi:hypothetical protein